MKNISSKIAGRMVLMRYSDILNAIRKYKLRPIADNKSVYYIVSRVKI